MRGTLHGLGLPIPRLHQHALSTRRQTHLDVPPPIADRKRARQVQRQIACSAEYHTGLGLSAVALGPVLFDSGVRMMRAVIERVDSPAGLGDALRDGAMRLLEELLGHASVRNTR